MNDGSSNAVRRALPEEREPLVAMFRRSFWDDPVIEFLLPNEMRRAKPMDAYMRMVLRYGFKRGRVNLVEGENGPRVGSVWLPPDEAIPTTMGQIRAGFLPLLGANLNWASQRKFFSLSNLIEHHHKEDVARHHWYLWLLASDVTEQGKGWGTKVLEQELREADLAGMPCYVETGKERNLLFYEKQGFALKHELPLPGGGPPLWTMIRAPMA
ncbi:MAG: GNAT family N-acetyltransferase [Chloroflexota bacterium]